MSHPKRSRMSFGPSTWSLLALLVILSMVVGACAAPPAAAPAPAEPATEPAVAEPAVEATPVIEEEAAEAEVAEAPQFSGTVVVGVWQEPKGLIWPIFYEAHTNSILDSMYYKPLALDENDELYPLMLEELPSVANGGISEDGTVITLKFKDGFTWHDGVPVTSADFKFTWEFIMNPDTAAQTSAGWSEIESVDLPDDLTAVVTLKQPYVPFIYAVLNSAILPKHALEGVADPGNSDFARAPVGNGPFVFQEWIPGDRLVVTANPDSPLPPKLERIIFKFVPDVNTLVALVRTGDVDIGYDYREPQIPELEKMESVTAHVIPGVAVERYYFNQRNPEDLTQPHPILSDINVRKAIAMGMDRWSAVDGILQGYGKVAVTEMDNHPWFNEELEPVPYDPEMAKQLLDEAGWVVGDDGIREKDGVRLSLRHSTTAGNQVRENLQVLFQQNLQDIGVEMVIDNYPSATLFGGCATDGVFGTSNFDIMGFTNRPAFIDLTQEWSDFFLSSAIKDCETNPAGSNAWALNDPAVDEALACSLNELDPDARLACIKEAQKLIYDTYVVLYVYDRVNIYSSHDRVEGFNPTVFGDYSWNFEQWAVAE